MATLRHAHLFRAFLAVVAEGSITAAAQKLGMTQPALTKSLHKLEGELGVPLLERLPRGVALTVYGRNLLPHAQRIVAECRLADLELQSFGEGHRGMLTIGAGLMLGATLVPTAMSDLHAHYPGVALKLVSGVTETTFPRLRAGELDMFFGLLPPAATIPDFLVHRAIVELDSRVVAGTGHPLARRPRVDAAELAEYPWVVIEHDREMVANILTTLATEGAPAPRINAEVSSLSALVRVLRSGVYLSCFAEPIAAMPDLGLTLVPYRRRFLRGVAGVVMHRSLERYAPAAKLVELVAGAAAQLRP